MKSRCAAQASTEFLVICIVLAAMLGMGLGPHGGLLGALLEAMRTAYARFSFALSIPT